MKLSIVVPCYNESKNLEILISKFNNAFDHLENVEIILVNNGSTDDTIDILKAELSKYSKGIFTSVNLPQNLGYGGGILKGLELATGSVLGWTHADLQSDPADILKAYEYFNSSSINEPLVKGVRMGRSTLEKFFSKGMQLTAFILLGIRMNDINAQPKLFSRNLYDKCMKKKETPMDFSLDLYVLYYAKVNGLKVIDFQVKLSPRNSGEPKGGGSWITRIPLIKNTLIYIWKLRKF